MSPVSSGRRPKISKGGDTTTSTTTATLPEYMLPHVTGLLDRAKTQSNQGYTTYNNPRLANFSGDTNAAFDMVRNQATAGVPGAVGDAQQTAGGLAGYQSGNITTGSIPDMNVNAYMNPYINNVLDVQKQRATQSFAEQQAGRNDAAIKAGAFGGNRRFVQDSLAQRDNNQQMQQMEAEGLSSAYDRATGLYTSDQSRSLQAQMANEDARRMGAGLGLDAAKAQVDFAQQGQNMNTQNIEALSNVGAKTQQRTQAGLDLAYQDFNNQRDWGKNQLATYASLIYGAPNAPSSTTSTTQPAPDFLSQLVGLGTTGLGIWDLFN